MRAAVLILVAATAGGCLSQLPEQQLNGSWQYAYLDSTDLVVDTRTNWRRYQPPDNVYSAELRGGALWFRTTIRIEEGAHLMIPPASVPGLHRVYIDGNLVRTFAVVRGSEVEVRRVWPIIDLSSLPSLPRNQATLMISSHTADDYEERGIMGPIWLGHADSMRLRFLLSQADTLFLGFIFAVLSLVVFAIALSFSRDWSTVNFAFFLASLGALSVLRSDLAWYLSGMADEWFTLLRLSFYAAPLGLLGIALGLFQGRSRRALWALSLLLLVFFGFSVINETFSIVNVWSVFGVFLLLVIPAVLVLGALSIVAALRGNREQRFFSVGLLLFLLAALIDLVDRYLEVIPFGLIHWALLIFVGIVLYLVADRFFQAQRDLQGYAANLEGTNRALRRFVPDQFLSILGRPSIVDVQHGDQVQREMTVLFSDIRSFTELSESMTPQENFNFLNSYLRRVGPIIRENGGFIDKYIGDAIMALFEESASAVRAAVQMHEMV